MRMRIIALLFPCITILFCLSGCGATDLTDKSVSPISQAETKLTEELGIFLGSSVQSEESVEIEVDGEIQLYSYLPELAWEFTEWLPVGTEILFTYTTDAGGRPMIQSVEIHGCGEACPH